MVFQDKNELKLETEAFSPVMAEDDNFLPTNFLSGNGRILSLTQDNQVALLKVEVSTYRSKTVFATEVILKVPIKIMDFKDKYSLGSIVWFQGSFKSLRDNKLVVECKRMPQFIRVSMEARTVPGVSKKPLKGKTFQSPLVNQPIGPAINDVATETITVAEPIEITPPTTPVSKKPRRG
jgi:hypothetical protein